MTDVELFAVVTPGFEDVAAAELIEHGFKQVDVRPGGVSFRGHPFRANVKLGIPTRILQRVGRFKAYNFAQLEKGFKNLDLSMFGGLTPQATCHKSRLYHSGAIEERVSKWVEPGDVSVFLRLVRDKCTVSIDTSGQRLHRRGWRIENGPAPLRETLAHALLRWAGWTPGTPLVDPMCGSGTTVIEAAAWACGQWPGQHRQFLCEKWASPSEVGPRPVIKTAIYGSDKSAEMVAMAQRNATRAGVDVAFTVSDARDIRPDSTEGLVVCNPPYGRRIRGGDPYGCLGELLAGPYRGYNAVVLVPHEGAMRKLRRPVSRSVRVKNGGISLKAVYLDAAVS